MADENKKISKVKLSGEFYEIYSRLASAIDPNGGFVVSSVPELTALSGADLSGKVYNGSALNDIVSALQAQIKAASEGAVLSEDIFTTTSVGYITKGKTLSAGTPLQSIWTSALSQYVKPSVSVSIKPSTTLYAYPETATITGITGAITNGTKTVTSYAIYESTNTATTSIAGFETKANVTSAISIETTAAKTFTVTASDSEGSVTGSTSISFCWPYIYGVATTDQFDFKDGTKITANKGAQTCSYEPVGYYWFASDKDYGKIKSIKDNGGDDTITDWVESTAQYAGHDYYVYCTKEQKAAAGKFKFVY